MPRKPQFVRYTEITRDNYADLMKNYERLVFHWLSKSKSPRKHWASMTRQFWEQVWIDRKKYDKNKGALSTWLGWRWKAFYLQSSKAAGAGYEEAPLSLRDGVQQLKRVIKSKNWGLEPHKQIDKKRRSKEFQSVHSAPYESPDAELALRQLITNLSEDERKLLVMLENGASVEEIAKKCKVSGQAIYNRIEKLRLNVNKLLDGSTVVIRKTGSYQKPIAYWVEWFKTWRDTAPTQGNKYTHAEEIRTRNKWLQKREL